MNTRDRNGNHLTRTINGVTEEYTYDGADKLLEVKINSQTVKEFTYDSAGRTTSITTSAGTTTLSWDYEDRLLGITYPNTSTNAFSYNAFGARLSKTDSSGTSTYTRNGTSVIAPVLSDGTLTYTPGISTNNGSSSTFSHADIKNSLRQTGANESTTATTQYDAFGNVISSSGAWSGPFKYGGQFGYQTDTDSGLKLLGHRYYDSSTGRFLTHDRAKHGMNWTAYSLNDPVALSDPTGEFPYLGGPVRVQQLPLFDSSDTAFPTIGSVSKGLGTGLTFAPGYVDGDGQLVMGRVVPRKNGSYYVPLRSFHLDLPHGEFNTTPHINAEIGPLKGLNHHPMPDWIAPLGKNVVIRSAGRALLGVGLVIDVIDLVNSTPQNRGQVIGRVSGGWGGAAVGAAIGTGICPGIGTLIGAMVGGIIGYYGGQSIGLLFDPKE